MNFIFYIISCQKYRIELMILFHLRKREQFNISKKTTRLNQSTLRRLNYSSQKKIQSQKKTLNLNKFLEVE